MIRQMMVINTMGIKRSNCLRKSIPLSIKIINKYVYATLPNMIIMSNVFICPDAVVVKFIDIKEKNRIVVVRYQLSILHQMVSRESA